MFSLFGCFGKKPATSIDGRLEELFPGRFQVLASNLKVLDVAAQFRGEKQAIVAEKGNSEIQFVLDWQKGGTGLGLDAAAVTKAHARAQAEYREGKRLAALLRQQGLERFAVGVIEPAFYVQVFAEPSAALREQALQRIKAAVHSGNLYVEFMEPAAYQTKFQEIIPRGHWLTEPAWQREQKTVSLDSMTKGWKVNAESRRSAGVQELAFGRAKAWAEENLPKSVRWTPDKYAVEVPEKHGLTLRFGFPYFTGQADVADEPSGYVCVQYDTEKAAFSPPRKQKEF